MSKLLAVLVAIFAAAWFAVPAFATDPPHGYIEICKATTGTLTGPFTFTVDGVKDPIVVQAGTCSKPVWVSVPDAATVVPVDKVHVTVTEQGHPWFMVSGFDYRDWKGVTHTTAAADLPEYAGDGDYTFEDIPVVITSDMKDATVVHVTNDPVTGTLEICKYAEDTSGASGTFAFGISSPEEGWLTNLPAMPDVSVTIGADRACSMPITVPAGPSIITERAANGYLYVTGITVTPWHHLIAGPDISAGTVEVNVPATADDDGETMVAFTNSMATLKVCKKADGRYFADAVSDLGPYSFSSTGAPAKFSLNPVAPDYDVVCHEVGRFAAGAQVTVAEDAAAGTAVQSILLNKGAFDEVHGDVVDLAARTVTFYIRPGLNEVMYTNMLARSVPLKVCKIGTGVTGTFSFATSGATGYKWPFWGIPSDPTKAVPATFTVLAGQCTNVGYFPFNSTVTITEAAGTLLDVAIDPTSTAAVLVSKNIAGRSGVVYLGNYEKAWSDAHDFIPAIVDFTNGPGAAPVVTPTDNTSGGSTPTTVTAAEATAAAVATAAPTKVVAPAKATKVLKVAAARIVSVGKFRYVVVRVNGNAKMARIHVTLVNKQHKVVSHMTRYVATNKAVRVKNLRLKPTILSVKVAL